MNRLGLDDAAVIEASRADDLVAETFLVAGEMP
jgi:hypothetical protein